MMSSRKMVLTAFWRYHKMLIHRLKLACPLLTMLVLITAAQPLFAAVLKVEFDNNAGGQHNNAGG